LSKSTKNFSSSKCSIIIYCNIAYLIMYKFGKLTVGL
jgi:hypothetical protein